MGSKLSAADGGSFKKEEPVLEPVVADEEPVKKKRGRPAKNTPKKGEPVPAVAEEEPVKKKRGRPAKNAPKKEEPVPAVAEEAQGKRKGPTQPTGAQHKPSKGPRETLERTS